MISQQGKKSVFNAGLSRCNRKASLKGCRGQAKPHLYTLWFLSRDWSTHLLCQKQRSEVELSQRRGKCQTRPWASGDAWVWLQRSWTRTPSGCCGKGMLFSSRNECWTAGGCGPLLRLQRVVCEFGFYDFVRVWSPAQCWGTWTFPTSLFLNMFCWGFFSPLISASSAWGERSRQHWLCLKEGEVAVMWFLPCFWCSQSPALGQDEPSWVLAAMGYPEEQFPKVQLPKPSKILILKSEFSQGLYAFLPPFNLGDISLKLEGKMTFFLIFYNFSPRLALGNSWCHSI